MSQESPKLVQALVKPGPRRLIALLITLSIIGAAVMIGIGTGIVWWHVSSALKREDVLVVNARGMIRSAGHRSDYNRVSYRSWEADTVVVAVPPPQTEVTFNPLRPGDHCYVHGSTLVRVEALYKTDVLLAIEKSEDRHDTRQPGDCPIGTMFIANDAEAIRMIWNLKSYREQQERDRALTRGRLPRDASNVSD